MKKNNLDNFIDVSSKGRIEQARKLTKLGMRAKDALMNVDKITVHRLIGKKLDASSISDYLSYDIPSLKEGNSKVRKLAKDHEINYEGDGTLDTKIAKPIGYHPFQTLLDKETEDKILSSKGHVNKAVSSFYHPKAWGRSGEITSPTTGKTYDDIKDVWKEENRTLSKTVNKKPSMNKKLTNIPTLWHAETNSSEASNGGCCQQSALTNIDWSKKHGFQAGKIHWNEDELKEFAEISKVHQNNEYDNYKNYKVEDELRKGNTFNPAHSGISGSVPVWSNNNLQKRFKYYSRHPMDILTALKGNRTYLASIQGHAFNINKSGDKYNIATTGAPFWSNSKTQWLNKVHKPAIFIDPNDLDDRDRSVLEFLKKRYVAWSTSDWPAKARTEAEKAKVKKQVDVNSTKARN